MSIILIIIPILIIIITIIIFSINIIIIITIIITATIIIIIISIIIISITSFCAMPSAWKYTVCVLHNGQVVQEVKEYNNFDEAIRKLERLNALYAVKARLEWDDVFVVIATRD
jgi:hypothetical protein